jgi:hypothetical protein
VLGGAQAGLAQQQAVRLKHLECPAVICASAGHCWAYGRQAGSRCRAADSAALLQYHEQPSTRNMSGNMHVLSTCWHHTATC